MGLKAPKLSLILVAAVFVLSCFGFTLFVWKSFGGPTPFQAHGYRFHVVFGTEASQMTPNADVRISGVSIGKVIKVEQKGQGEGADVLVEVDPEFAPIPSDTRAIVRFKSLLGEAFLALTPGSQDAPLLEENGTLAAANVGCGAAGRRGARHLRRDHARSPSPSSCATPRRCSTAARPTSTPPSGISLPPPSRRAICWSRSTARRATCRA